MSFRFRRLRHVFCLLPQIYSGTSYRLPGTCRNLLAANMNNGINRRLEMLDWQGKRYSTVSKTKRKLLSTVDILSFIQTSLNEPEGYNIHQLTGPLVCWMNKVADNKNYFKKDGIFLVFVGEFFENSSTSDENLVKIFERVKLLQQRYPFLQVLVVQYSSSTCLKDISAHLLPRIIKEYANFPILLTKRNISEMANGPCYIISKGFQNPLVYPEKDVVLEELDKVIHNLNTENRKDATLHEMKSSWVKSIEVVKEPDVCSALRNLLLSYPGCISVEETGNRLFLSDVNHHRIIVFNSDGEILDAIGSSPGFEDGEFENAKLMRPAASFYHASEDCLYFVDSENHAIRRADMGSRVVETIFPAIDGSKSYKGLWKWILDKIWMKRNIKLKSDEFNSESLLFPWHLLKSPNNGLFVLNQSFGTLWVIDLELGFIRKVVKEPSKIVEICGQMILEKSMPLRQMPTDWLQQQIGTNCSFEGIPYAGLMSSVATCQDHVVFCDTVGQMVLKLSNESGSLTSFQFSNFGILGLPYWLSFPLEQVYAVNDTISGADLDHLQHFRLLPGRVDIEIDIDIPQHTDLVELPQDCIWRQARGAAAEVSGVENKAASTEKVGAAQQWYDEIDNLSFSTPEEATSRAVETTPKGGDEVQENKVRIDCTVNTSPGTSEVIIYAALYLRLKKNTSSSVENREKKAARIAESVDPKGRFRKDLLIRLLSTANRDLEELVFIRPLHVRLKFNSPNHPKADNSKDIVLTESNVKVHIAL